MSFRRTRFGAESYLWRDMAEPLRPHPRDPPSGRLIACRAARAILWPSWRG